MTEPFDGLSPLGAPTAPVLADGPFIVERTDPEGTLYDVGFNLTRVDAGRVAWAGQWQHSVRPVQEPVVNAGRITFTQATDGNQFLIRPLQPGDFYLAGTGETPLVSTPEDAQNAVVALATVLRDQQFGDSTPPVMGEDNLYLTRDQSGRPLALVKMATSHGTLIRLGGSWVPLNSDDALGESDIPVRDGAVLAWDSGNLDSLKNWVSDDRFTPADALELWVEINDQNRVQRLFLRRTQNRVYSRQNGVWVKAQPDPNAMTVDVTWSAIGAWDDGDLVQLAQVEDYDVNGDQAA